MNANSNSVIMSDHIPDPAAGTDTSIDPDAARLLPPELAGQIRADLADPSRAAPSAARRPRPGTPPPAVGGFRAFSGTARSVDHVASLLAFAEQSGCRDGWSTVGALGLLFDDPPCDDRDGMWHAAVERLSERFDDFSVLLAGSSEYPEALLGTVRAPAVLFVRGSLHSSAGSVAMVGSRAASAQALAAARVVAAGLADAGVTVVSGLARGVDTAAHRGALDADGRTVAVFGTGVDVVFPPENRSLVERVVGSGAVVSQFPPGAGPSKTSFPARNAVIAGLSAASVVVDAAERSGTRIEIDFSLEFGRPVLLWAPVLGERSWARRFAAAEDNVHLVSSVSEILDLAGLY